MSAERVTLGRIGGPYGIKGWVKLLSYTDPRENILAYRTVVARTQQQETLNLEMDQGKRHGKGLIAHFAGFDTPESVQRLNGAEIEIAAAELPQLEAGDYYWHQLTGLRVINTNAVLLGSIDSMLETGANDVMIVAPTPESIDERERLIPWLPGQTVLAVDIEKGEVQVDWEPDYLE